MSMTFDATINLGNIITVASIIVAVVGAYFALRSSVTELTQKVTADMNALNIRLDNMKESVTQRHQENQRSFDGITRAFDESKTAYKDLTRDISSIVTRVAVVEQIQKIHHPTAAQSETTAPH